MFVLADIYRKLFAPASHTHTKSQITDFPNLPDFNGIILPIEYGTGFKNDNNVTEKSLH